MSTLQFYFLFPSLFMLHELEEIIWMPSFVKKISLQIPYKQIFTFYTPFAFNAIVMEQLLLLMITLYLSYQFNNHRNRLYLSCVRTSYSDNCYSKICAGIANWHFYEFIFSILSQK